MIKTLGEIRQKITDEAQSRRMDAAFGGEMGDRGASSLESQLGVWMSGVNSAAKAFGKSLSDYTQLEVPSIWEEYFLRDETEYQDYLKLRKKYEGR